MAGGCGVALLNRGYGGAHETFEQCFDFVVQLSILVSDGGLGRERKSEAHRALREGMNLLRNILIEIQSRGGIASAIDELKHAENFALRVAHGQGQQRARAVSGITVVTIIEVIRTIGGNFVSIGKIQNFAAQRGVTSHGVFGERQNKLLIGKFEAIVLREHETKMAALGVFFYKIKRAGISGGDFTCIREDQAKKGADFTLRRKGDSDFVEFFAFALPDFQRVATSTVALDKIDIFEGGFERSLHDA